MNEGIIFGTLINSWVEKGSYDEISDQKSCFWTCPSFIETQIAVVKVETQVALVKGGRSWFAQIPPRATPPPPHHHHPPTSKSAPCFTTCTQCTQYQALVHRIPNNWAACVCIQYVHCKALAAHELASHFQQLDIGQQVKAAAGAAFTSLNVILRDKTNLI